MVGCPFDYRYRVITKAVAQTDPKVVTSYTWKCVDGRRNNDLKWEWFRNVMKSHRKHKEDLFFSFLWETHLTHDFIGYDWMADRP